MKRIYIILILISFMSITGCSQNTNTSSNSNSLSAIPLKSLTQKEMLEDFEYMYRILKENYPFFEVNKRMNRIDWLEKKNEYIQLINTSKNDEAFLSALNSTLKDLNNGHTHMVTNKQQYDNYKTNEAKSGPWFDQLNNKKAFQRYSSISDKKLPPTGSTSQKSSVSTNVNTKIIDNGKTAYFSIKSFHHLKIEEDIQVIKPFFNAIKDYKTLIIDIRGNGGGSDLYWRNNIVSKLIGEPISYKFYYTFRGGNFAESFIKSKLGGIDYKKMKTVNSLDQKVLSNAPPELKRDFKYYYEYKNTIQPNESINFKGQIYLLVDKEVYSSSEMFAVFAKSTKFAKIIGERTGGDGIGIGPILCVLPNSGYIFRFSQVMGLTSNGICNDEFKTEPDIVIDAKISSNIINDLAIQYILNLNK